MPQQPIIVQTSLAKEEQAKDLAQILLDEELIACAHIVGPILSMYPWQGQLCQESEYLLLVKTAQHLWAELESRVQEYHPYEVPEIIALPIDSLSSKYQEWISQCIKK